MKLIDNFTQKLKPVDYFGIQFYVDKDVNYITTDADGDVYAWKLDKDYYVIYDGDIWCMNKFTECGNIKLIGKIDLCEIDAKNTLITYPVDNQ